MKQCILNICEWTKSKITDFDLYPKVISFTCAGKDQYHTFLGGIVSCFIRAIILAIALSLINTIFQRGNSSFSMNTIQKDLTNDSEKHYFAQKDVYFALSLKGPYPHLLLDPTYVTFTIMQAQIVRDNSIYGFSYNHTLIPFEFCKGIPYVDSSLSSRYNISTYLCPKSTDFFLRANFNSDNYSVIQIMVSRCQGPSCKSDAEIDQIFNLHIVDFIIVSTYLDFDDYDSPVHYYIQDLNYYYLSTNYYQEVFYNVKRNTAFLNDNILIGSLGFSDSLDFYSIDRKSMKYGNIEFSNTYLSVIIAMDQQISQYNRSVYSFFDMLGFVGGVFSLLNSIAYLFIQFTASRNFYSFAISTTTNNGIDNLKEDEANKQLQKESSYLKNNKREKGSHKLNSKIFPILSINKEVSNNDYPK